MRGRTLLVAAAGVVLELGPAPPVGAQAWLPPKGEAWFALGYGNLYTRDHFFAKGERVKQGHIRTHNVVADVGYAVTDRITVRANLPYVLSTYSGEFPHQIPLDDGSTHGTFTDLRFGARVNVLTDPVALTPFVDAILPTHHYEHFGHSVAGTALKQLLVGLSFGRRLDPFLPGGYVQGRYSYAFVEEVLGISHDRSNLDLQLGYFLKPSVQLYALAMGQKTHGGLIFDRPTIRAKWTAAHFHHHGQVSQSDLFGLGLGAVVQVTPIMDVSASFMTTLAGRNDHAINSLVTLGMTVGFSPRQVLRRLSSPGASSAPEP